MTLLSNVLTQGDLEIPATFVSSGGLDVRSDNPNAGYQAPVRLMFDQRGYVTIKSDALFEICPHFVDPDGKSRIVHMNKTLYWPSSVSMQEAEYALSNWASGDTIRLELTTLPYFMMATNMEDASRRALVRWEPRFKMTVEVARKLANVSATRTLARSWKLPLESNPTRYVLLRQPATQRAEMLLVWADSMSERGLIKEK